MIVKYLIKICYPADHKLTPMEVDEYQNIIQNAINKQLDNPNHSIYITYPHQSDIEANRFNYLFTVRLTYNNEINSKDVFNWISEFIPISVVQVVDCNMIMTDKSTGWRNDGTTSYSNNSIHYDCSYKWYFQGEPTDYEVIDVEQYCRKMNEKERERFSDMKYMWSSTCSWYNPIKADNLEDALFKFEEYYYHMLWDTIQTYQEKLNKATDNFRHMAEYKGYRMCHRRNNV